MCDTDRWQVKVSVVIFETDNIFCAGGYIVRHPVSFKNYL